MSLKERVSAWIEWLGRADTIVTLLKVYVAPVALPILAVWLGYIEHQPWMWILMAGCLVFGGVAIGALGVSIYRERKDPANKLVYEGTHFGLELVPAPMPAVGNRAQRRQQSRNRDREPPQMLGANELHPVAIRKMAKGQVSVSVKNRATFPLSIQLVSAATKIDDLTPPRSEFPRAPSPIGPGQVLRIADDAIDLEEMECATLTGEMEFVIKYGRPGRMSHELRVRGQLQINVEKFGFVSGVTTHWT